MRPPARGPYSHAVNVLHVAALLIYTFGVFAYAALVGLWLQWIRGSEPAGRPHGSRHTLFVSGALWIVSLLWFVTNLGWVLIDLAPGTRGSWLWWSSRWANLWLAITFPPLITHMVWTEARDHHGPGVGAPWRHAVTLTYVLAAALGIVSTVGFLGNAGIDERLAERLAGPGIAGLFVGAALYAMAIIARHPAGPRSRRDPRSRSSHLALFGGMAMLFVLLLSVNRTSPHTVIVFGALEIAAKSLPLAFMFVGTYFESRFEFFDIFVKRGISLVTTLMLLAAAFGLTLPLLKRYDAAWTGPWVYAVVLLPLAMAMPWLHARIGRMLDERWFGRRFSTVDAVKHFLAVLRSATTDDQLVERAETGLATIFDAPAAVRLAGRGGASAFAPVQEADIVSSDGPVGRFLLGERRSEAPYFSEDVALLGSLADVFASVFDNLRLQRREQEQDRRARDLSLHASRSELKALRAQINPHFLFNALNAVAGLIHRDPAQADRTIEKLADVFRYALRGSDAEWTALDAELEFVRAYLDVEQARFGSRLRTDFQIGDDVRGARVPTMVVQTIVENAVKHGVAAVKGQAIVTVSARRDGTRLSVVVEDNGPGFPPDAAIDADPRRAAPGRGGYGLANVRQRLEGYFGDAAALVVARDAARGRTVVSIEMPFTATDVRTPATVVGEVPR